MALSGQSKVVWEGTQCDAEGVREVFVALQINLRAGSMRVACKRQSGSPVPDHAVSPRVEGTALGNATAALVCPAPGGPHLVL